MMTGMLCINSPSAISQLSSEYQQDEERKKEKKEITKKMYDNAQYQVTNRKCSDRFYIDSKNQVFLVDTLCNPEYPRYRYRFVGYVGKSYHSKKSETCNGERFLFGEPGFQIWQWTGTEDRWIEYEQESHKLVQYSKNVEYNCINGITKRPNSSSPKFEKREFYRTGFGY
jgi:hypothetical protein